jgi:hypothetical protein
MSIKNNTLFSLHILWIIPDLYHLNITQISFISNKNSYLYYDNEKYFTLGLNTTSCLSKLHELWNKTRR